jgi:hypothetical protein
MQLCYNCFNRDCRARCNAMQLSVRHQAEGVPQSC